MQDTQAGDEIFLPELLLISIFGKCDIIKRATGEIIASRGDCTYFQFSHGLIQKLACFIIVIANNLGPLLKLHFKSAHVVILLF